MKSSRLLAALLAAAVCSNAMAEAVLEGRAVLPAQTFAAGPRSGSFLRQTSIHGVPLPFVDKQPVQGISGLLRNADGSYLALVDNGFGAFENSCDFELRLYNVRPNFKTASAGDGAVAIAGHIRLSDPQRRIPFTIVNQWTTERSLTGSDFDLESVQRAPDGTLWLGDEFGPFLLHVDANGIVLEPPIVLPDFASAGEQLRAPQNPYDPPVSAVKLMMAARADARRRGSKWTPVCSPSALSLQTFDIERMHRAGFPVVVWTVNDKRRMLQLMAQGVDGVITDRPDLLREAVKEFQGGKFLLPDGRIDRSRFDAQAHRGGRNLRPESTLPAMELALDLLMPTLEFDIGVTADGKALLGHDARLEPFTTRRLDRQPYTKQNAVLIKDKSLAEIQSTYVNDQLLPGQPTQRRDLDLSPVAAAFAQSRKLLNPYTPPSLEQLFDFLDFYVGYYREGSGAQRKDAAVRARNAAEVRFNIETKTDPQSAGPSETADPEAFVQAILPLVDSRGLAPRVDIQSFDFRTLRLVQEKYPAVRTVYLFDALAMQSGRIKDHAFLAGLAWPPSIKAQRTPPRVERSGGFEGMALSPAGDKLYPMLEKSLIGDDPRLLWIFEFDLRKKRYTGDRYAYFREERGGAIGDFVLFNDKRGLVIERDDSEGDLKGFKSVFQVALRSPAEHVSKERLVDLLKIADPARISALTADQTGDIGLAAAAAGGATADVFSFPFQTIESIVVLDPQHLVLANDNNFPFSVGRHRGSMKPDDTEFILLRLDHALPMNAKATHPPTTR